MIPLECELSMMLTKLTAHHRRGRWRCRYRGLRSSLVDLHSHQTRAIPTRRCRPLGHLRRCCSIEQLYTVSVRITRTHRDQPRLSRDNAIPSHRCDLRRCTDLTALTLDEELQVGFNEAACRGSCLWRHCRGGRGKEGVSASPSRWIVRALGATVSYRYCFCT